MAATGAAALAVGALGALPISASAAPSAPVGGHISFSEKWARGLTAQDTSSSPIPITIGKTKAFVVGVVKASTGESGAVYAVNLRTGKIVPGWPVHTPGGDGVESTPSINGNLVYVGIGNVAHDSGGYLAISAKKSREAWLKTVPRAPGSGLHAGVQASMAVGKLGGSTGVAAGSLGQFFDALKASSGATLAGFPWMSTDSEFSTPAIANLYGNGKNYLIGGAEQTAGRSERKGGHLWVIDSNGDKGSGTANPYARGANCADSNFNQGVMSSPAVGRFLRGDTVGIAVGTGYDFHTASSLPSDSYDVYALNSHCQVRWSKRLDGVTLSSPALVDARGNGQLQIAEGTTKGVFAGNGKGNSGSVYLLNGSNGGKSWQRNLPSAVIGSITSANLGGGHQDLLVPTTNGLYVLNGKTGTKVAYLASGVVLQNSALVTDDSDGTIGITVVGDRNGHTFAEHYEVKGTSGRLANETGAWPMFHHDAQLTGSTLPRLKR